MATATLSRVARRERAVVTTMLVPAAVLLLVTVLLPALLTPIASFFHVDLIGGSFTFTGVANWIAETGNGELLQGTVNTVEYGLLTVPVSLVLGMCCALAIDHVKIAKSFWRTAFFLPTAATLVAMAVAWRVILAPGGPFDVTVGRLLGVTDWLSSYQLALPAVAIVGVWQQFGYNAVLFAAGLSTLPKEPLEAATIDGANAWQRFWRVMLPMMGPTVVFAVVTSTMTALRAFDQIQVMTAGGPGSSTRTLPLMMYQRGLSFLDIGGGAVLATVMLAIVLIFTVVQITRPGSPISVAKTRPPSARRLSDELLGTEITRLHKANYGVYGVRKMHRAMLRQGWMLGRDQTGRIMRDLGPRGVKRGTKVFTTHADPAGMRPTAN